ncbi:MAG: thiamine phosphate synthase [Gemmatimonadetes bacterium]|nr:thiamine phosphate synthase [Gemmatimonadota bacterium]
MTSDAILARSDFAPAAATLLRHGRERIALHLRGPGTAGRRLWEVGCVLARIAGESGATLIVNDRLDIALATGARALQLGARAGDVARIRAKVGAGVSIGRSVHSEAEAITAAAEGSDFVLLGTIYASPSHPSRPAAGVALIRATAGAIRIPVIAIGGMSPERVAEVSAAGAHGVAVVSAVWNVPEPTVALERFLDALAAVANRAEIEP